MARISLIVAKSHNNVIGKDNKIPWYIPEDLRWFKKMTMYKPVIMGRKTWESLPEKFRPLPDRTNIVVTRQKDYRAEGAAVINALDVAIAYAGSRGFKEVMVIGGEEIYKLALPLVTRMYVSEVAIDVEGDAFFPSISLEEWMPVSSEFHPGTETRPAVTFTVYDRL